MSEIMIIRKVNDRLDTNLIRSLVEESLSEGHRHLQRLVHDYEAGTNLFDQPGEALFIAYRGGEIIGICGLNRDPNEHRSETGRVRRLYVTPQTRRYGVGRQLMKEVISEARLHYPLLILRTDNPAADLFYRSLGFSVEPDSEHYSHYLQLV
ncbi:GNAT family N-acetyltransferase [Paenibacillus kobensis]|uniref:GNAT family N-acetyltransferase n=1 Tax=Paenibacillus kobensis TaxID=59841 RepID=UPI001FEC0BBB|nr:GNAT family N-acetyltransferase [Paenibacillus kobensis]